MSELRVIAHFDSRVPQNSTDARFHKECRSGGVSLAIEGDQRVDSFFFDSTEVSLVCLGNLLGKENTNVSMAAHLASLYLENGDEFARSLRGSFAIILHDHRTRKLKAWTDHFGVQRLVYSEMSGGFAVASGIEGLLKCLSAAPEIDPAAVLQYLQYACIPTPKTIYKGIYKLAPGHQLTWDWKPSIRCYWDMSYQEEKFGARTEAAWAADTLDAVRSAVSLNLAGLDAPRHAGCFLSGGTDSSTVAGLVDQLTCRPPNTFSIGFDDPRYNEIRYARIAAQRFDANHHEYFVTPSDILTLVQKAARVYDEPFGNSSIIPTYFCARLAAEHGITHLLAGDGGDEIFGGNSRYTADRVFQRYGLIPAWIRRSLIEPAVSAASSWTRLDLFRLAASYVRRSNIPPPDRYWSYSLVSSAPGADLFAGDFLQSLNGNDPIEPARNHFLAAPAHNDLNRWLYMDLKITIADNDLRKVTAMSRLAGVTPRYPFLDPALAEFTGTIPAELKVRGSQLRYLFKKAMKDILPQEIIAKKKHGFGLPYSVWLGENKPLRDFTFDVLGSSMCRQRGYFRRDLLEWLWSQYQSVHRGYYGDILWMFLMFELWHVTQQDHRSTEALELVPVPGAN